MTMDTRALAFMPRGVKSSDAGNGLPPLSRGKSTWIPMLRPFHIASRALQTSAALTAVLKKRYRGEAYCQGVRCPPRHLIRDAGSL